jgi:hypothetical protein
MLEKASGGRGFPYWLKSCDEIAKCRVRLLVIFGTPIVKRARHGSPAVSSGHEKFPALSQETKIFIFSDSQTSLFISKHADFLRQPSQKSLSQKEPHIVLLPAHILQAT